MQKHNTAYSMFSNVFLIPSGKSLNLVDFVKGGGPTDWVGKDLVCRKASQTASPSSFPVTQTQKNVFWFDE